VSIRIRRPRLSSRLVCEIGRRRISRHVRRFAREYAREARRFPSRVSAGLSPSRTGLAIVSRLRTAGFTSAGRHRYRGFVVLGEMSHAPPAHHLARPCNHRATPVHLWAGRRHHQHIAPAGWPPGVSHGPAGHRSSASLMAGGGGHVRPVRPARRPVPRAGAARRVSPWWTSRFESGGVLSWLSRSAG